MFGNHFYHQRIRKAVAVFGSLFNNINIVRKDSSGAVISQVKVPLSYSPKRDFLSRLDAMQNGEEGERQIAVKLPRISFEIVSMNYDAARQLPKMNNCIKGNIAEGSSARLYTPVPYIVQFQLNIYSKSQDDALQIVEQILPYFTPHYTLTVNPLEGYETVKEDSQITLQGITFSDDYEAQLEARRTIIYTLDFDMKLSLYKNISDTSSIITQYEIEMADLNGNEFLTISDSANRASPLSGSLQMDNTISRSFEIINPPRSSYDLLLGSEPSNGTATVVYDSTETTLSGVTVTKGTWSYTPNSNFFGTDQFNINLLYGGGAVLEYTIDLTINPV
jgi:hypothetical protein